MKKSKILISAVTMFSLCITPMSVYAQVDPNSNIENTISQTKSAENLPTPVLQEKEIEVSNGTGYSLNNIQGAETVKALEQGTIVISYKATGENAIQSLFSVGNGTNGNQNRHFHIYVTNSGGVGMELRNTDGDFKYTLDRPAAVRGSYKGERVSNTIAFKADKENNTGGATAEAQIVEMPDGSLKTYLRTGSGYIAEVTSIDGGETWSDRVPLTEIATTSYGTQLSVINYSQPIDGKPAIILSAPNATNGRKNGKIWIGLINETGQSGVNKYSVEWKYCYSVDTPQMGYSYSCLTELPDGKVGLLYEKYDSWSRNELHLKNILKYEKFTIDELKVQP